MRICGPLRCRSSFCSGTCGGAIENRFEDLVRSTAIAAQEISTKPSRSSQKRREAVGLPSLSGITISARNFCSADRFAIRDEGTNMFFRSPQAKKDSAQI
jgi:hypothetical protein